MHTLKHFIALYYLESFSPDQELLEMPNSLIPFELVQYLDECRINAARYQHSQSFKEINDWQEFNEEMYMLISNEFHIFNKVLKGFENTRKRDICWCHVDDSPMNEKEKKFIEDEYSNNMGDCIQKLSVSRTSIFQNLQGCKINF